jgi:hypothetical protein
LSSISNIQSIERLHFLNLRITPNIALTVFFNCSLIFVWKDPFLENSTLKYLKLSTLSSYVNEFVTIAVSLGQQFPRSSPLPRNNSFDCFPIRHEITMYCVKCFL